MMDSIKLSNFIVIKSFSDSEKSLLDCVMPFVEYSIAKINTEYIEVSEIKDFIKKECLIDVPTNTIRTLLKRLKRDNKVTDYENWTIVRCVDNYTFSSRKYEENLKSFSRDINKLIINCKTFCDFDLDEDELTQLLYDFIALYQHNIDINEGAITSSSPFSDIRYEKIARFVDQISKSDNIDYNTFKNIFYGFILGQFVAAGENFDQKKIQNCTVYVDTDFLLRILDMQAAYFTETATELLQLLTQLGFSVIVLPETIAEACAVLRANHMKFVQDHENLKKIYGINAAKLDGIMGAFFRKEMTASQISDFIDNIETEIGKLSIDISLSGIPSNIEVREKELNKIIEYKEKNARLDCIENSDKKEYLQQRIREKAILDAKILSFIRYKRGKKVYKFQDAKYLLLSCDNTIYRINKNYHKYDGAIPECFSESSLTSLLFMSSTSKIGNVPVKLFTSLFQASKYIDYGLLTHFHSDVIKYLESNPEDQQYLTEVFRNQNLFAEISGTYEMNPDLASSETDLIKALFDQAKESSKAKEKAMEDALAENRKLKCELEALRESPNSSIPDSNSNGIVLPNFSHNESKSPEVEGSISSSKENTKPTQNHTAERILRNSILYFLLLLLLGSVIWAILGIDWSSLTWTATWWLKAWRYVILPIFLTSLVTYIHRDETMDKIIKRVVYEEKQISLKEVVVVAFLHSLLYTAVSFVIPFILNLIQ